MSMSLVWFTYYVPLETVARPYLTPKNAVVGRTAWTKKAGIIWLSCSS